MQEKRNLPATATNHFLFLGIIQVVSMGVLVYQLSNLLYRYPGII